KLTATHFLACFMNSITAKAVTYLKHHSPYSRSSASHPSYYSFQLPQVGSLGLDEMLEALSMISRAQYKRSIPPLSEGIENLHKDMWEWIVSYFLVRHQESVVKFAPVVSADPFTLYTHPPDPSKTPVHL